jgi:deoxyadenosine/deoxycytidine kinase
MKETTFINIFGGPGAGKSTNAARLFSEMKVAGYDVELVTEVAKDFVWEERYKTIEIQPYITMKQYRNLYRMKNKVEYVVTDAPLLLGILYARKYNADLPKSFYDLVYDLQNQFLSPSINIMLTREHAYDVIGRNQTKEQAEELDKSMIEILDEYSIDYNVMGGEFTKSHVLKMLKR